MHAFLIVGNNELLVNSEVETIINKYKIELKIPFSLKKVEDSKELKKLTKFSYSKKTAIILEGFDEATNETVNSVLKNIEEPNNNLVYILTAKSTESVLPTILSRCEVITTDKTDLNLDTKEEKEIESFLKLDSSKRFEYLGKIKERSDAVKFVNNLIKYEYKLNNFTNMKNYLLVLKNLKLNGNVSLQLTNLLVRMEPATYGKK